MSRSVAEDGVKRRLAAILAADVVGYTRLMKADETGTLSALKGHRDDCLASVIAAHRGRIVKLMGDGLLVEFASVVDAVAGAVTIQRDMAARNAAVPEERRLLFRIGINLGDVIVEGEDLYGDGVNIAARLEGLAEPGGICLSDDAYRQVRGKLDLDFEDLGEREVKNVKEPLRVYRVALTRDAPERTLQIDLSLPDYPSIAVLPFTNMSADADQEFFSDGITEDIITVLSKIGDLLVIARNSTFIYKGKAVDVKQVSREQGVRYVLEGSVRKASNRVRVTAQLIDATTGHHLWAERYDRDLEDIFAVQDEITREIVVALDVHLRQGEQSRLWSSGTRNLEAWECARLGAELADRVNEADRRKARKLFERALVLDPNYAVVWVKLGWVHFHDADVGSAYGAQDDRAVEIDTVLDCAQKALELDSTCADAYAQLAMVRLSKGDHDQAIAMAEKAVTMAPGIAEHFALYAAVMSKAGQAPRAIELIRKAMRQCPVYPVWYLYILGSAHRMAGQTEAALAAFREAIKRNPDYLAPHVGLASTLGELGQEATAGKARAEILRLEPEFSVGRYMRGVAYRNPSDSERFAAGLRKAGLPA